MFFNLPGFHFEMFCGFLWLLINNERREDLFYEPKIFVAPAAIYTSLLYRLLNSMFKLPNRASCTLMRSIR
jgi:hypothetical protein